jgi:quercetin dioxygenase-like cupin family protein
VTTWSDRPGPTSVSGALVTNRYGGTETRPRYPPADNLDPATRTWWRHDHALHPVRRSGHGGAHPGPGILSQTLSNERDIEFLLFAFAPGEELSEHTAARPAIVHTLEGEGELTVGGDAYPARLGTWLRMAAEVKHSLVARTPMRMALYLLPR